MTSKSKASISSAIATNSKSSKRLKLTCELAVPELPEVNGTLLVCGMGDMGQLGLGEDEVEKKRPTLVSTMKSINVVDVCAGGMHSLCLTEDGKLYSFGCNDEGALGRDSTAEGSEFTPEIVDLPGVCVKISAGDSHSACLLADGRVFAWGSFRNSHGNMGLTIDGNKRLPTEMMPGHMCCNIASGADHLVMLSCNGKVYTMGCGEQGQLGRVALRTASGDSRRGKNVLLEPNVVEVRGSAYIETIWATTYGTFARSYKTKEIFAFGLNNYFQLGLKKKTADLVATPMKTNLTDIKTISGGQHHTLSLTADNICLTIGRKDYGRLGLGKTITADVEELTPIKKLKDIADVACGDAQSFAIARTGSLYAWGMGSNLQLGTGTESDADEPTLITSKQTQDKHIIRVASGGQHTLFLIKNENNNKHEKGDEKTAIEETTVKELQPDESPMEIGNDIKLNGETSQATKKGQKRKR